LNEPIVQAVSEITCDSRFLRDAVAGLCAPRKSLPSEYLYDHVGRLLFEAFTELPGYGLNRADERLFDLSHQELERTGAAARWLPVPLKPDDIRRIGEDALSRRIMVVLSVGAIGTFIHPADLEFLIDLRDSLKTSDLVLLSTDLEKPQAQLLAAYDDPLGLAAAFNRNVLLRMNRELDADFRLERFRYRPRFNCVNRSVEMHLESLCRQTVHIGPGETAIQFREGETILTQSHHQFVLDEITALAWGAGFRVQSQWLDSDWPSAHTLLIAC
jgi:L-histidine Nalpha-methyltransferase